VSRSPGPPHTTLPGAPERICIVRLSALGDVVHTLPLAAALKEAFPESRITWVTQPLPARVLEGSPVVDELLLFRRRSGLEALGEYRAFANAHRGKRFDLVLVPQVAFKAGLLSRLIAAPVRLGYDRRRASDLQWLFTNRRIAPGPRRHVVDEALEFARALGVTPGEARWGLALSPEEAQAKDRRFAQIDGPAAGVVVSTSDPRKNWPAERWAPIVDALEERWGFRVLLLGGPSSREREIADRIRTRCRTEPVDELGDDIRRLMWLLDGCSLVVSPDTGPLHIAVALGTPAVGLYGRTNPNVTGPYGPYRELVADGYARRSGEDYGTSRRYRSDGMERVTPRMVLERIGVAVRTWVETGSSPDPD
jgi:heptosyltransferase I